MMHEDIARRLALHLCMQGVGRYLDCLNGVVKLHSEFLSPTFVEEVKRDFASYSKKMAAEGLPFVDLDLKAGQHEG